MLLSLNRDTDLVSSIRFANLVVVGLRAPPTDLPPQTSAARSALRARRQGSRQGRLRGGRPLSRPLRNCADLISRFVFPSQKEAGLGKQKAVCSAPGGRRVARFVGLTRDRRLSSVDHE